MIRLHVMKRWIRSAVRIDTSRVNGLVIALVPPTRTNIKTAEEGDPSVLDAAIICAAQRVEHYEIAGYGCARTFAGLLGDNEAADLLQQTLDEEGQTDKRLTELAESSINQEAAQAVEA